MSDVDDNFENPDENTDASEGDSEDSQESQQGAADSDNSDESKGSNDEALRTLQSERDKERARANKLERELKKFQKDPSAKGQEGPQAPPEVQEWITAAQENMRNALFAENPRFAEFGLDSSLITGDTPAEMRASAKSLSSFVEELHGKVRSQVLEEHGFDPEPRPADAPGRQDFNKMDKEKFDALVENALRG